MSLAAPLSIQTAYLTDPGMVRDENQDACFELRGPAGEALLLVADGMGGHQGGATASRMVVETAREFFELAPHWSGDLLRDAITEANTRIRRAASQQSELMGMGTTVVAMLFGGGGGAWVAHVGDSRAYRLRDGALERLTRDHSTVAELVRLGTISEAEAQYHPRRNEVLRSVGVRDDIDVELAPLEVKPGDRLLLCSDGLSCVLTDEEIAAVLGGLAPDDGVRTLVESANARGGPDNVTVMVSAVDHRASYGRRASRIPERGRAFAVAGGVVAALIAIAIGLFFGLFFGQDEPEPSVGRLRAGQSDSQNVSAPPTETRAASQQEAESSR